MAKSPNGTLPFLPPVLPPPPTFERKGMGGREKTRLPAALQAGHNPKPLFLCVALYSLVLR